MISIDVGAPVVYISICLKIPAKNNEKQKRMSSCFCSFRFWTILLFQKSDKNTFKKKIGIVGNIQKKLYYTTEERNLEAPFSKK